MNNIVGVHILLVGVWFLSQDYTTTIVLGWVITVARYLFYLLTIRGFQEMLRLKLSLAVTTAAHTLWAENRYACLTWAANGAVLVALQGRVRGEDILLLSVAYVLHQYLFKEHPLKPTINYGTGMACSYFQGYLKLVIPGDGTQQQDSFVDKICKWEDREGVVFPVKKLLVVITTSLWCPPDLRHFNRHDHPHLPQIEACEPLEEVQRDVAGVRNRSYKNTAYKIFRPDGLHPPVYAVAECATPIHTLHGVIHAHSLYRELVDVDTNELVEDFCAQLERVVSRSPECAGKIEIVRFDDSPHSGQYLPQVLLDKVAALEPDYLGIIERRAALNDDGGPQDPPPPGPQAPQAWPASDSESEY